MGATVFTQYHTECKCGCTHSPEFNDKHCPRCQIPTHVLTILNSYVSYFIQYQISYLFTTIKYIGIPIS